jgi:hypothetical protein
MLTKVPKVDERPLDGKYGWEAQHGAVIIQAGTTRYPPRSPRTRDRSQVYHLLQLMLQKHEMIGHCGNGGSFPCWRLLVAFGGKNRLSCLGLLGRCM